MSRIRQPEISEEMKTIHQMNDLKEELRKKNGQLVTLREEYLTLLRELNTFKQLSSLAPLSGIFNIRSIQSDEEIQNLLKNLVLARLRSLQESEGSA